MIRIIRFTYGRNFISWLIMMLGIWICSFLNRLKWISKYSLTLCCFSVIDNLPRPLIINNSLVIENLYINFKSHCWRHKYRALIFGYMLCKWLLFHARVILIFLRNVFSQSDSYWPSNLELDVLYFLCLLLV